MPRSAEEQVEDFFKRQLEINGVRYFSKTEFINSAIDEALRHADSKTGGSGGNYPDIRVLRSIPGRRDIPVMIEAKGTEGKLVKYDRQGSIELESAAGRRSAVTDYAVNGAVHYCNAVLDGGAYKDALAIGINGWVEKGELKTEAQVFYVSEDNGRQPVALQQYSDLAFLAAENAAKLAEEIDHALLTPEEREDLKRRKHAQLEVKIKAIHQSIYDDKDLKTILGTNDKLYLFSGLIMAALPTPGSVDLTLEDLKGNDNEEDNDGALILRRIKAFLKAKGSSAEKTEMIVRLLSGVFKNRLLWRPDNGESKIRRLFKEITDGVVPILKLRLNVDFTGIILNSLKDWLELDNDKKNDVVLTPRYVASMMARLARTDMNSFVWDTAMGSGGFLIAAMEQMIDDVKRRIPTQHEREAKIRHIKENQLLGIEVLGNVYILAVINMILTGDGSAHVLQGDSFNYQGDEHGKFPYNVFLLNPPYSADGKGFNFVERALSKMTKGYGCVLIQENAGSGNGLPYTKEILKHNTLLASIHMADIFKGRSSVQTAVYLFQVNRPHDPADLVTFIDFSNDGYFRQNRRKSSEEVNLQDTDHAKERYKEIEAIILNQKKETDYYNEANGTVIKDTITLNGDDWTFAQHKKIDTVPTIEDFKQTVKDYLAWKVSQIIQNEGAVDLGKL